MTNFFRIPYTLIRPIYERTPLHTAVIDELDNQDLKNAYRYCRVITRHHAKTFYLATRFLPRNKQRSIFAIYALCRYLDDLVDETEDLIALKKITTDGVEGKLDEFRQKLLNTYHGIHQNDPIMVAFSDVLKRYDISIKLPMLLMEGVKSDLIKSRFENFDELYDYSYKVASVVGLMTSEVFGYSDDRALDYAVDLGIAMQLTNILRDVGEDIRNGRVYLPQDEMKLFGVTDEGLKEGLIDRNFIYLMRYQITRARKYYKNADKGIRLLSRDSRLPVYLAHENYSRILDKIEENNYDVLSTRAYLNTTEKLAIVPKLFYRTKVRI